MALKDQVKLHSVDTSNFYNESELKLHKSLSELFFERSSLKEKIVEVEKDASLIECEEEDCLSPRILLKKDSFEVRKQNRAICNRSIREKKIELKEILKKNKEIRRLNPEAINEKTVISMFTSVLTRTIGIKKDEVTEDLIVVQTYYFEVLKDIVKNGFVHNGEHYIFLTASAGQIRTKKCVFIKKSVWKKHEPSFTCGLTEEHINESGGCNTNKYLAYLALINSSTEEWKDFDIDRCIVVDDLETVVNTEVDHIGTEDYKIERKTMDIKIESTDGCGIMCHRKYSKTHMFRSVWFKGLLVPFPMRTYINKAKLQEKDTEKKRNIQRVVDIYGKVWDIEKDEIDIIFTKSQFKMHKYYQNDIDANGNVVKYGWDKYKELFKEHNCQAGICNVEPDEDKFSGAKINYQMLQTLADMSAKEVKEICEKSNKTIEMVGKDRGTMLKIMGAIAENPRKNGFQKAIYLYPELLRDESSKNTLKEVKRSYVKDAKGGRLEIDGKYTYIIPDLYAFCEKIFSKIERPNGLLGDGEVFCRLYEEEEDLDILRSPHLFREHAIRKNRAKDKEFRKWFKTNGLYISNNDAISKIIMCDWDGDTTLVTPDKLLIEVARRNMVDARPLYYEMGVSSIEKINNDSKYEGMINAYSGGNIGMVSNEITKIWNSSELKRYPDGNVEINEEAVDSVRMLCKVNNEVIDYAKCLWKNEIPCDVNKVVKKYTKGKVPHFFIYAKDKLPRNVEDCNDSTMNRISKAIVNRRMNFDFAKIGKVDYRMLMSNSKRVVDREILREVSEHYEECNQGKRFRYKQRENKKHNMFHVTSQIKRELLEGRNVDDVVDVLVIHLYKNENARMKTLFWDCFGDVIANNIKNNLESEFGTLDLVFCEECGKRFAKEGTKDNSTKYCSESCSDVVKKRRDRSRIIAKQK